MNNITEIEKSAILAAFLDEKCFSKIMLLDEKYIGDENCKKILTAMKKLKYQDVNIIRIMEETDIDYKWLAEFMGGYTCTGFIDTYINQLLEHETKEKLKKVYESAINDSSKNMMSNAIIAEVEERQNKLKIKHITIKSIYESKIEDILKVDHCVKTGLGSLDNLITGLYNDELIIIASRPSIGKSALALFIANNISQDKMVIYYSLEMSQQQMAQRLIAMNTNISLWKIRKGMLNLFENENVKNYWEKVNSGKRNLFIIDNVFKLRDVTTTCEKFGKPDVIIIDYLQLLESDQREKRYIQVGDQSRAFKELSKNLGIPIVALSQLNRQVELRQDGLPALEDLRESGSLEQDADVVILIHGKKENSERRLIIAKSRSSKTGYVDVNFNGDLMQWK